MSASTPNYGRAGRDLKAATIVGVGLLVLVIASLFINSYLYAGLAAVMMVLAARELSTAMVVGLSARMSGLLQVLAPAMIAASAIWEVQGLVIAYGLSVLAVLAVRLADGQEAYVHHVTRSIFVLTYAPFLASFSVLLAGQDNGAWKVLSLVLLTAATDLGGYIAGVLFGAHPMAPKISPKKSWEGLAGALVLQTITGIVLWVKVFDQPAWQGALVGIVMVATAVIGDLVESMIKRDLGIKDMSAILPGHGGIMDRLDSLLVNAFIAWVLFGIFL